MLFHARTSIRAKLALLAGVPVVGALLLALFVAHDARQQAASAASLGSIEDLARLTASMADVLHAEQDERAVLSVADGRDGPSRARLDLASSTAARATDAAAGRLEAFLSTRDRTKLPARLTRGLADAQAARAGLELLRGRSTRETVALQEVLAGYGAASSALVSATAALSELSDDGTMLRNISALVALLELEERASIEQAIVGYAAARGEFPPGAYKALVTTTTEEDVYDQALRTSASDDVWRAFEAARKGGLPARELLDTVLKSTEDAVTLEAPVWSAAQGGALNDLRVVERLLLDRLGAAAASKATDLRKTIRLSVGVSIAILLLSVSMAIFVGRGVQASVGALTDAAERVRSSRDFSIRARRASNDELGMLTETFNEMLAGMQSRDAELEQHRSHLERLVVARTAELGARNSAMRLVLDNVEQGLATIGVDGSLHSERSAAFDRWFGAARDGGPFCEALAPGEERLRLLMKLGWEQVAEGLLPAEVSVEQMPKRFDLGGRHFTLSVQPILRGDDVAGALLVVSDVTAELEARKEQARQKEEILVFRRIAGDKRAFAAFLEETGSLIDRLRGGDPIGAREQLGIVHTVKGNAAQYDVRSVAEAAHDLESAIADAGAPLDAAALSPLFAAWQATRDRVAALLGTGETVIELSRGELERLLARVAAGAPSSELATRLRMLLDEPVATRFARLAEHVERLAARLGKPAPRLAVRAEDVRLPQRRYASFWAALVHVARNAIDHGIEDPAVRTAAGKPARGAISFSARLEDASVLIEVVDDGAGVDWERLAARARAAGLPARSREEIERTIFVSGISSLEAVTDVSGRGVGLAAVWDATVHLGGTVRVTSVRGRETRFVFRLPTPREPGGAADRGASVDASPASWPDRDLETGEVA
jgi:two-component system chemotaxis sensor kinase CheA